MFLPNDMTPWCGLLYRMELFFGVIQCSCINAIHNRAMGFYLGVGIYTPNAAVSGKMGWVSTCGTPMEIYC